MDMFYCFSIFFPLFDLALDYIPQRSHCAPYVLIIHIVCCCHQKTGSKQNNNKLDYRNIYCGFVLSKKKKNVAYKIRSPPPTLPNITKLEEKQTISDLKSAQVSIEKTLQAEGCH